MKPRYKPMACADCGLLTRLFVKVDEGEWSCMKCGYLQSSSAAGAADLCWSATWHHLPSYQRYAEAARAGGIDVPTLPLNSTQHDEPFPPTTWPFSKESNMFKQWDLAILAVILVFIFWPWGVGVVDIVSYIITGAQVSPIPWSEFPKGGRAVIAVLWPILWFFVAFALLMMGV